MKNFKYKFMIKNSTENINFCIMTFAGFWLALKSQFDYLYEKLQDISESDLVITYHSVI